MTSITNYQNDGANWQARGVLACILGCMYEIQSPKVWAYGNVECPKKYDFDICVGRFENCREQGYVFTLYESGRQLIHYAVYEHRNSDNLIVLISETKTINTPTPDQMFNGRGKYDYNKSFSCGKVMECAKFILDDMSDVLADNYVKRMTKNKK